MFQGLDVFRLLLFHMLIIVSAGTWSVKCDVFAFGVVLIGLISKKVFTQRVQRQAMNLFCTNGHIMNTRKQIQDPNWFHRSFHLCTKVWRWNPFFSRRMELCLPIWQCRSPISQRYERCTEVSHLRYDICFFWHLNTKPMILLCTIQQWIY